MKTWHTLRGRGGGSALCHVVGFGRYLPLRRIIRISAPLSGPEMSEQTIGSPPKKPFAAIRTIRMTGMDWQPHLSSVLLHDPVSTESRQLKC